MKFTIAICTYNRAKIIEKSLDAALNQSMASRFYEILVVDNNSTDNTKQIVKKYMLENSNLRLVSEPIQGLSHARNRAYKEARNKIIVYVDDDAVLGPDYLMCLENLFNEEKKVGAVGGPVSVGWLEPVPSWYEPGLDIWYNYLNLSLVRRVIKYPKIFYGTNMAFFVSVLKQVNGFSPNLGRTKENLADSEEAEIILRIEKLGLKIFYDPELCVIHYITKDRLDKGYLRKKAQEHGRSQCIAEKMHPGHGGLIQALSAWAASSARTIFGRSHGKFNEELIRASAKAYARQWMKFGINRFSGCFESFND